MDLVRGELKYLVNIHAGFSTVIQIQLVWRICVSSSWRCC